MQTYYTYILKHIETGKIYYGFRKTSKENPYDDLGVKYFTSSKIVKTLGFNNFYYSVVETYTDKDECYWAEQELIKSIFHTEICLNRQYQKRENSKRIFMNIGPESEETRKRKSIAQKKLDRLTKTPIGFGNKSRTGMKVKPETSIKMSLSRIGNKNALGSPGHTKNRGRKYFHNPITKQRKMFEPNTPIPDGWLPGMGPDSLFAS